MNWEIVSGVSDLLAANFKKIIDGIIEEYNR